MMKTTDNSNIVIPGKQYKAGDLKDLQMPNTNVYNMSKLVSKLLKTYDPSKGYKLRNLMMHTVPKIVKTAQETRLLDSAVSVVRMDKDTILYRSLNLLQDCYVEIATEYKESEKSYTTTLNVLIIPGIDGSELNIHTRELYRTDNINQVYADYINAINALNGFQIINN